LEARDVAALTTTQVRALTTDQVANLSIDQVVALTTSQIVRLTTSQITSLTTDQVAGLTTTQVGYLTTVQLASLTTTQVSSIEADDVSVLTTSQVRALTTAAVAELTTDQIVALTSTQVKVLLTSQIASLSSVQIAAVELTDVTGFTSTQISKITTTAIQGLTTDQITSLTVAQANGLSAAQLAVFTGDQLTAYYTPIVLDLNGNGIQTNALVNGVNFDLNNDGKIDRAGWIAGGDALLVSDLNGDGIINDGGELFGEGTVLADGSKAKDGYLALKALDSNLDGLINAQDAAFGSLKLWVDNGNGITDQGELKSLTAAGITSLSLDAQSATLVNNGNLIGLMGSYTTADGNTHTMGDVWFSVDASGNRTFDLAAAVQQAGSSSVNLGNASVDTLKVSLNDVLSLGQTDIAGIHHVTINGDATDTVQLSSAGAGWTAAGAVTEGCDTYMIYVNTNAQLLINDKIHTVIV